MADDDRPQVPARIGQKRGPRGLLTEEVLERCVAGHQSCMYVKDVCAFAGIHERRYHDWIARGYAYVEHIDAGGAIIEGEDIYQRFALAVDLARAEARVEAGLEIRAAWRAGDWRAAAWFLERSDPQHWGKVSRVEMTGREGAAIEVDVTALERRLAEHLTDRPLIIDAEVVAEVTTPTPAAPAARPTEDDDTDYYVIPYADVDYDDFSFDDR